MIWYALAAITGALWIGVEIGRFLERGAANMWKNSFFKLANKIAQHDLDVSIVALTEIQDEL